jgi:hypothetical protein
MGGDIEVESAKDQGSTFRFALNLEKSASAVPAHENTRLAGRRAYWSPTTTKPTGIVCGVFWKTGALEWNARKTASTR